NTAAELAGLLTGLVAGCVMATGIAERKPRLALALPVAPAIAVVAFLCVLPLRGTIDARPAIAQIAGVESRTAAEYAKAVEQFTRGRLPAKALAQTIERSILPAIEADHAGVNALRGVPAGHHDIGQQQIDARGPAREDRRRFGRRPDRDDLVARTRQDLLRRGAHVCFVLDEEDARGAGGGVRHHAGRRHGRRQRERRR